eukprot:348888-Hanusia_phi.AAC.1
MDAATARLVNLRRSSKSKKKKGAGRRSSAGGRSSASASKEIEQASCRRRVIYFLEPLTDLGTDRKRRDDRLRMLHRMVFQAGVQSDVQSPTSWRHCRCHPASSWKWIAWNKRR